MLLTARLASAQPTVLSGNHQVAGNLTVSDSSPSDSRGTLTVLGQTYLRQHAYFSNPTAEGWNLENSGGDFVFYPGSDYIYRQIRFRNSGEAAFPKTVSIGNIGTTGIGSLTLAVGGKIGAQGIYIRTAGAAWPDYVFQPAYALRSLAEVEQFVRANCHLPEVPSAATVQAEGLDVGAMEAVLLKKVEELTLYLIELRKQNEALQARVQKLEH